MKGQAYLFPEIFFGRFLRFHYIITKTLESADNFLALLGNLRVPLSALQSDLEVPFPA